MLNSDPIGPRICHGRGFLYRHPSTEAQIVQEALPFIRKLEQRLLEVEVYQQTIPPALIAILCWLSRRLDRNAAPIALRASRVLQALNRVPYIAGQLSKFVPGVVTRVPGGGSRVRC